MATPQDHREATAGNLIGLFMIVAILTGILLAGCADMSGRPTLYVFTSPTCMPCLQDYPKIKEIIVTGMVTTKIIVVEERPDVAIAFKVTNLPTYILVHNGKVLWRTHQAGVALKRITNMGRRR